MTGPHFVCFCAIEQLLSINLHTPLCCRVPPLLSPAAAAVLKAYRLKDTSTLGKQNIYLNLTAGPNSTTSDVHNGGVHTAGQPGSDTGGADTTPR